MYIIDKLIKESERLNLNKEKELNDCKLFLKYALYILRIEKTNLNLNVLTNHFQEIDINLRDDIISFEKLNKYNDKDISFYIENYKNHFVSSINIFLSYLIGFEIKPTYEEWLKITYRKEKIKNILKE